MNDEDILDLAQKHCTTYCFLGDEKYHFTEDDMLAFAHSLLNSLSLSNAELVRDSDDQHWKRRHFAGVSESKKPMVWDSGFTSWTKPSKFPYNQCRRPTKEELGE